MITRFFLGTISDVILGMLMSYGFDMNINKQCLFGPPEFLRRLHEIYQPLVNIELA